MAHPLFVLAAGLVVLDALTSKRRRAGPAVRPSFPRVSKPKKRAAKKAEPDWHRYERTACASLGEQHLGGPGRADCEGDKFLTEVKHHSRPIGVAVVERIYDRSINVGKRARVVSSSGFTGPATMRAAELAVELHHKPKRAARR